MGTQQIGTRAIDAIVDDMAGEPTVPDIQQKENVNSFVMPVETHGPVQVQTLPAQDASIVLRELAIANGPVQIIGPDMRRTRLVLVSATAGFLFGFESSNIVGKWPVGVPLTINACREVWVLPDGPAATLTVLAEFWTG